MKQIRESCRGLPEWLIRDYLEQMGARPEGEDATLRASSPDGTGQMAADDWRVSWSTEKVPIAGGTLSLTEFRLLFEGEDAACEAAFELFMKKAQRGGG